MSTDTIERVQLNNDGFYGDLFESNNNRTWPVIVTARVTYMNDGVTPCFAYVNREQLVALGADPECTPHDLCWMLFSNPEDPTDTQVEAVIL